MGILAQAAAPLMLRNLLKLVLFGSLIHFPIKNRTIWAQILRPLKAEILSELIS